MADKEYVYTSSDFSLSSTIVYGDFGSEVTGLSGGSQTQYFQTHDIVLAEGESIKSAVLTASMSMSGSYSYTVTVNNLKFVGSRKLNISEFVEGDNWKVDFYFCLARQALGDGALSYESDTVTKTMYFTDVKLTITTGVGSVFDGQVSSLNEGEKVIVTEANGNAVYTLVHHEYNAGKALIFRDDSIGTSRWRHSEPSSSYYNSYIDSTLDQYFINTWYPTLPAEATQFLQMITYPVRDSAGSGSSEVTIDRMACTLSAAESGLGGNSSYGTPWNYTNTLAYSGSSIYWTREPVGGMAEYAYSITASGDFRNNSVTSSLAMRPTLGVLEEQLVRYSESDGGYIFCSQCVAPEVLYINGLETDASGLNREANLTLSWTAGTAGYNAEISGYAVWYSTSVDGTYELYGITTETSMTIIGPAKTRQTYYFKVQTLGPEDADYCNSELSSTSRSVATKTSNVSYYDGTKWLLATVKYYNGSSWVEADGAKYYDGSKWV